MPPKTGDTFVHGHGNIVASWIFGGFLILVLVAVLFVIPEPSQTQRDVLRFLMALTAAFLSFFFLGGVVMKGKMGGQAVGAGGGFVLFLLIQFVFSPFGLRTAVADAAPALARRDTSVALAQEILQQQGLYQGDADGVADRETREAIRQFQREHNLQPDGYVGPRTLEVLRAAAPGGGEVEYVTDSGTVTFVDAWDESNVVPVLVPQLRGIPGAPRDGSVRFYREAGGDLAAAFAEIERRGLLDRVRSWDGAYAPRTRTATRSLSAHALGIAFDLNARWNRFGVRPPAAGEEGSLAELVSIFEAHGFTWGGTFARPDPNHFQWNRGQRARESMGTR